MDFVYICKDGPNEELRYSIRSVIANYPDPNIWVVGGKPNWYGGNYLYVPQTNDKYHNMYENWDALIRSRNILTNFILMNDDFFIMKPIDKIPMFYGGDLIDKVELYEQIQPTSRYTAKLRYTYETIKNLYADEPMDYELHVPMPLNKTKLKQIFDKTQTDLLWRSMYGNCFAVGGQERKDVKVYVRGAMASKSYRMNSATTFISSDDYSFKRKLRYQIKHIFPTRSSVEVDN